MNYQLALLAQDMHNSVLPQAYSFFAKQLGIEIDFQIYNVAEQDFLPAVQEFRKTLHGFTVTMPYKVRMTALCDTLDASAQACGSVNTVLVKDGQLTGFNTDGWGMMKCLQLKGVSFAGKRVVMVGAGGVARSIAYQLSVSGAARVDVLNIYEQETAALTEKMGPLFFGHPLDSQTLRACAPQADLFINASVLGQVGFSDYDDLSFLDMLPKHAVVFDVNYSNPAAKLPIAAHAAGLPVYIGNTMSACQGVRAMQIWTGRAPSDEAAKALAQDIEAKWSAG